MFTGAARARICWARGHFLAVFTLFFTNSDLHRAAVKIIEGIRFYGIGFCGTGFCGIGRIGTRAAQLRDDHFPVLHVVNTLEITCNYAKAG